MSLRFCDTLLGPPMSAKFTQTKAIILSGLSVSCSCGQVCLPLLVSWVSRASLFMLSSDFWKHTVRKQAWDSNDKESSHGILLPEFRWCASSVYQQTFLNVFTHYISFPLLLALHFKREMWLPQDLNILVWRAILFHGLWDCLPPWWTNNYFTTSSLSWSPAFYGWLHPWVCLFVCFFILMILFFYSKWYFLFYISSVSFWEFPFFY